MIPFFALFDPGTDKSLETFGVTIGGLAAAIYYIRELFRKKDLSPQPLIVAMEKEFVTKRELEKFQDSYALTHKEVVGVISTVEKSANERIANELQSLREERREDVGELHEKINSVAENLARVEATTELQNQTLASLNSDVKQILSRLPRRHET